MVLFWRLIWLGVPENLAESELFGYEKGAFTGAACRKEGLFELASGGTLFLDEIGDISPALQVKLLRVLQEKTIRRLGGIEDIPIKARIITATNRDLEELVKNNQFREDLYYRLNVARITLPPLRKRMEEIPVLTGHILGKLNRRFGKEIETISPEVLKQLRKYDFPGNIRELENILERSIIFCDEKVLSSLDMVFTDTAAEKTAVSGTLKEMEVHAIVSALIRWEGNRTKAAEELGISRRTIFNKIKEYGLEEIVK